MLSNSKNQLQEYYQKINWPLPIYDSCIVGGTDHVPIWKSTVKLCTEDIFGGEEFNSKKLAEYSAAENALKYLNSKNVKLEEKSPHIEFISQKIKSIDIKSPLIRLYIDLTYRINEAFSLLKKLKREEINSNIHITFVLIKLPLPGSRDDLPSHLVLQFEPHDHSLAPRASRPVPSGRPSLREDGSLFIKKVDKLNSTVFANKNQLEIYLIKSTFDISSISIAILASQLDKNTTVAVFGDTKFANLFGIARNTIATSSATNYYSLSNKGELINFIFEIASQLALAS